LSWSSPGVVWLNSATGQVVTWTDTQVVATVGPTALTGVARVEQNGAWSNAVSFTGPSGSPVTLLPNLLNMVVGDTHTVQAVNSAGLEPRRAGGHSRKPITRQTLPRFHRCGIRRLLVAPRRRTLLRSHAQDRAI
jgi:hypothetical protein